MATRSISKHYSNPDWFCVTGPETESWSSVQSRVSRFASSVLGREIDPRDVGFVEVGEAGESVCTVQS